MQKSPTTIEIKNWLIENNPLGNFNNSNDISITNIDQNKWSGHFDYLIKTIDKRYVLRFKGPEWGDIDGVVDEYKTLKRIEKYEFGPKVHYLTEDFFDEPMMFEEYLEGELLSDMSADEQRESFPSIAKFIAKINSIPFKKADFPFQEPVTSYTKSKNAWQTRLKFILACKETNSCGNEILSFLPSIESILNTYEERLNRVIKQSGEVFIFESSHPGHLLKTKNGFRFFNWEQVTYGDPSYTLAVFLTSLQDKKDFSEIKKDMINAYLKEKHVPEFSELVDQRIVERNVSNAIYNIYTDIKKKNILVQNLEKAAKKIKDIIEEI